MGEVLAEGHNVFDTDKSPSGTIKYLASPADVIVLINSGKLSGAPESTWASCPANSRRHA
ncbi:MAG: hypothetical protein J2P26_07745 [Nocardiopsaceae bacterium]|nr:hypothetical protein [Nocardiopsaceae bacterium]